MRRRTLAIAMIVTAASLAGCRSFGVRLPSMARQTIAPDSTKEQIVAVVNRNVTGGETEGLKSWQSMSATFRMGLLPPVPGAISVQAPRNFRLKVSNPLGGGDELDVGSNSEEFWIWQKGMNPPYLLTSHHEDLPAALQHFKIPFQPDWLMEVLGVVPIDGSKYELHPVQNQPYVELVANQTSPTGETQRKIVRVSTKYGWVASHSLWGQDNRLIAEAQLDRYEPDPASKLMVPHTIRINFPREDLDLKISLQDVDVNPTHLPPAVWQVPQKNGYKRLDMGAYARNARGVQYASQETTGPGPSSVLPAEATTVAPLNQSLPQSSTDAGPLPFPSFAPSSPPAAPAESQPASQWNTSAAPAWAMPSESPAAPSTPQPRPLPTRDESVTPGRVRLDSLSP